MKKFIFILLLLISLTLAALAWLSASGTGKRLQAAHLPKKEKTFPRTPNSLLKLQARASESKRFTREKGYNTSFCFLIDMGLPSGRNRFFVYDLKGDSVLKSGLVTHGRCNEQWLDGRRYSNKVGGGCTSLGKYKIGHSYYGRFGLAYKLFGLEKSNDQAFRRYVVLHAHGCVPEWEVSGEICQSDGCPTVSPDFLVQLQSLINSSKNPVLLWIME